MLARHSDHRLRRFLAVGASLALGLAGSLLAAAPASAAGSTVTNTDDTGAGSLRAAIIAANTDAVADTITITATGTLTLVTPLPLITESVTIIGPAGGFTIDASVADFGLEINGTPGIDVSISDLSVTDATDDGIRAEGADLTLTRVTVSDSADNGVYAEQGNLTFTDVTVDNNDDDGLDIQLDGDYTALITGLTATNSGSNGIDAEVYDGATLTVDDAQINDNDGSGIYADVDDGGVTITGSTIENNGEVNLAEFCGGIGIDADDSDIEIAGSTIAENSGYAGGLCITAWYSDVSLHDLLIEENHGARGGGAYLDVYGGPDPLVLADSRIVDNIAAYDEEFLSLGAGGGILIHEAGEEADYGGIQILRTTIDGNSAERRGGGIAIENIWPTGTTGTPGVLVQDSTISNNSAGEEGGGGLSFRNDRSADNSPAHPFVVIENSTFSGNTADRWGAAIDVLSLAEEEGPTQPIDIHVLNTTVTNGPDGPQFGQIALDTAVNLLLANSIVSGNDAPDLYSSGEEVTPTAVIRYSMVGTIDDDGSTALGTAFASGDGNLLFVFPNLGPLDDNGGPTLTHLPLTGSLAIGAGDPGYSGLTTDQRGLDRVVDVLDMGAVEVEPALAETGADAVAPLAGGILLLGLGGLLLVARRRRFAR